MITAITVRDTLIALLAATFPELTGEIESLKADTVEKWPSAAVYLKPVESEPAAMRGHLEETIEVDVVIHRKGDDLEATLAQNVRDFTKAVFDARQTFTDVQRIYRSGAALDFTPDSKSKQGTLTMTFTAEAQDNLTT